MGYRLYYLIDWVMAGVFIFHLPLLIPHQEGEQLMAIYGSSPLILTFFFFNNNHLKEMHFLEFQGIHFLQTKGP